MRPWTIACAAALLLLTGGAAASRQGPPIAPNRAAWSAPQAPFRIAGNIWYVGSAGLAAYLLTSPRGHILLDATLDENGPMIADNIRRLGFNPRDIKAILVTHAHWDHVGGVARMQRLTGAMVYASRADAAALRTGGSPGQVDYRPRPYPPVRVDRLVDDGTVVRVGNVAMEALLTPGHTPGCTSWRTRVVDRGRRLTVIFPCSVSVAGNVLIGNRAYPRIVRDYRESFAKLRNLNADIVLPAHPEQGDVLSRHQRRDAGDVDAFIDLRLLGRLVSDAERDFDEALRAQATGH